MFVAFRSIPYKRALLLQLELVHAAVLIMESSTEEPRNFRDFTQQSNACESRTAMLNNWGRILRKIANDFHNRHDFVLLHQTTNLSFVQPSSSCMTSNLKIFRTSIERSIDNFHERLHDDGARDAEKQMTCQATVSVNKRKTRLQYQIEHGSSQEFESKDQRQAIYECSFTKESRQNNS